MRTVKFKDFNIANFLAFLSNASIGNLPHCIDIGKDKVYCKAAPEDLRHVKYTSILAKDVLTIEEYPEDVTSLILKFVKLSRLKDPLKAFSDAGHKSISGEIFFEKNKKNEQVINHLKLKSAKMNITVRCDVGSMIAYLMDEAWVRYSNRNDVIMRFDADAAFLKQLNNVMKLDLQNAISIHSTSTMLTIKSIPMEDGVGVWDLEFDGSNHYHPGTDDISVSIPKAIFDGIINKDYYTVNIVRNVDQQKMERLICVLYADDDNIVIANISRDAK
jgi:hypothetical protein